jgi:hypothetical protein
MNDLLQKRTGLASATLEENNEHPPTPDIEPEQTPRQFRELNIEAAKPPLRMVLEPPVEYDGQRYSELIFDFDAMIGKDFQRAEREFTRLYKAADRNEMPLPEMKHLYHSIIASHLANVPLGLIVKLPRRFYTPLRTEVLKACGSSSEEEKV